MGAVEECCGVALTFLCVYFAAIARQVRTKKALNRQAQEAGKVLSHGSSFVFRFLNLTCRNLTATTHPTPPRSCWLLIGVWPTSWSGRRYSSLSFACLPTLRARTLPSNFPFSCELPAGATCHFAFCIWCL